MQRWLAPRLTGRLCCAQMVQICNWLPWLIYWCVRMSRRGDEPANVSIDLADDGTAGAYVSVSGADEVVRVAEVGYGGEAVP